MMFERENAVEGYTEKGWMRVKFKWGVKNSDGIQGVRTGSREPVLGISARLANPFLEFQHV